MNRYMKVENTQMAYKNEKILIMMKGKAALKYHFPALSDWQKAVHRQRGKIEAFNIDGGSAWSQSSGPETEMDTSTLSGEIAQITVR